MWSWSGDEAGAVDRCCCPWAVALSPEWGEEEGNVEFETGNLRGQKGRGLGVFGLFYRG